MTVYGTSYFKSVAAARRYYNEYEPGTDLSALDAYVRGKIAVGEIHIGQPLHLLEEGDELIEIDNRCRYGIRTAR